jgi:serine phosphatase RsbU (regulator of sigma subunit)/tetratricopeptide (TPR) repeat protein
LAGSLLSGTASAQEFLDIDSLKRELVLAKDRSDKAWIMYHLGEEYFGLNRDSAILYLNGAYQLGMMEDDILFQSKVASVLAFAYQNLDPVKSTEYVIQSAELAEQSKDSAQIAYTYNMLGSHYRVNGDLDKSIEFYRKSEAIRRIMNDSLSIAVCYNNLGISYMMKAEYDTGLFYWEKSLEIKLALGQEMAASSTMANIAIYYKDIGRVYEALEYINQALEIEMRYQDYLGVSHSYVLLGDLYAKIENYPKAIDSYKMALDYADTIKVEYEKIEPLYGLAMAYKTVGNYKEAMNTLEYWAVLYQRYNDENIREISAEMQTRFETEKKEKENLLLKNQNETKDLKLKEEAARSELQQANNRYLMIGLGLAFALIVIIVFALRRVRKAKLQVEEQKHIVEEKNKEITDSINYAKRIQAAILPSQRIVKELLPDSFILYKPKDIVAGDFYWMEKTKTALLVAAADCTGHGVPGAMVSVICNNGLNRAVREYGLNDPAKILDKTREIVISEFEKSDDEVKDGMDISLFALYPLAAENGEQRIIVEWAGANNPLWVVRKNSNEIQEIKADKQPIGKFSEAKPFTSHALDLRKGDVLYVFTDGYQDQFGGDKGKKFKAATLRSLLLQNVNKPMPEQLKIVDEAFNHWKGNLEQIDDVCLIGVRL